MLKERIKGQELYKELSQLLEPLGFKVAGWSAEKSGSRYRCSLVIYKAPPGATSEDTAEVYRIVYPRLTVLLGTRDLSLEVSTPGLERVFKDRVEFEVFQGRRCKLWDGRQKAYFSGVIGPCSEGKVILEDWRNEDSGLAGERLEIRLDDVYKARLDCKQEDSK